MTLATRLKARMDEVGMSQAELARRLGLAQPTIAKLVSGASQRTSHLHRIARELSTTPAYLIGETEDPSEGRSRCRRSRPCSSSSGRCSCRCWTSASSSAVRAPLPPRGSSRSGASGSSR
ncbi:helix-turn-helix domain-containing protein [Sphingomonas panni]